MSYILDALSKSDAERQREQPPNLKSVHRSPRGTRRRVDPWQIAILLLVGANVLLMYLWLRSPAAEPEAEPLPPLSSVVPEIAPPQPSAIRPTPSTETMSAPAGTQERATESDAIPARSAAEIITPPPQRALMPQLEERALPTVGELPESVQRRLPDLTFASHIYSSDPRGRLVSINGDLSREGDRIAQDLTLLAITEEGVVFEFEGVRFRMSVLRDWSFR